MPVLRVLERAARRAALCSTAPNYRVGAAAYRSGKVIGVGTNIFHKTHTQSRSRFRRLHAEEALARRVDLRGAIVLVVRILKSGELAISKPCPICEEALTGAKRVYYIDREGKYDSN